MSALGQKQTYAMQQPMSAKGQKRTMCSAQMIIVDRSTKNSS
jgi:hypothetical protein